MSATVEQRGPPAPPGPRGPDDAGRKLDAGLVTAILAGAGLVAYAVLYFGCVLAYEPLGIEPADVGLGYAELLAGSAGGGVLLIYTALVAGGGFLLLRRIRHLPRTRTLLTVYTAIFALFGLVYIVIAANGASGSIKNGERPARLFGVMPYPWDAKVAEVKWLGETTKEQKSLPLPDCVLYLGQSSTTRFFYDPGSDEAFGLPAASTAMRIKHDEVC